MLTQTEIEINNQADEIALILEQANRLDLIAVLMQMKRSHIERSVPQYNNTTDRWFKQMQCWHAVE